MKYKVLEGAHRQNGKTYSKGEVVDTTKDLVAMFPNKFTAVGESDAPSQESPVVETARPESTFPPFAPAPAKPAPTPAKATTSPTKKGK